MPDKPAAMAATAYDFLCEHTASKSRVLALIAQDDGPRSLTAVLTCKNTDHAVRAAELLRHVLAARDAAGATAELDELCTALPDAPAASLRQAAIHAARATWPAAPGTLTPAPQWGDEESEEDAPAAAVPEQPRLRDLAGKVVRVATLREVHITDEDAVIKEAMRLGWEPIPASELDTDDPRDVVGALLTLTEFGGIPGARNLEEQAEASLLRAERGDELADWSPVPVTASFTSGWRLRTGAGPEIDGTQRPDMTTLFAVEECGCDQEDCDDCGWQLTPRTADVLLTCLSTLADEAYDHAEELGDRLITRQEAKDGWEVFTQLPPITFSCDLAWRRRMARAFDDLADDLEAGRWPQPRCTAEEMALHLAIGQAPDYKRELDTDDPANPHHRMPEHRDDYDWDACSDLLFGDHDVLMLFDPALDGIEDPSGTAHQQMGMANLQAGSWFKPFGIHPARDPQRGFRR